MYRLCLDSEINHGLADEGSMTDGIVPCLPSYSLGLIPTGSSHLDPLMCESTDHSGYEDERPRCSDSPLHQSAPPQSSGESSLNPHQKPPLTDRWCGKGGFADRKCTLDDTLDRWFDVRFPPLSIYHGGRDYLVLAEPLLERMRVKEKDVNVIKVTKLDLSEVSLFPQGRSASTMCSTLLPSFFPSPPTNSLGGSGACHFTP
jgi:hypothetical protein